jgi:Zn-dependent protease
MQSVELAVAGLVLFATVAVGLVAHELTHALVLRTLGVPYEITWFSGDSTPLIGRLSGTWASVRPKRFPVSMPTWGLQLSATAPLVLAVPLLPVVLGVVELPFAVDTPYAAASVVGWLACSIPSPQDFSVFWHADRILEQR